MKYAKIKFWYKVVLAMSAASTMAACGGSDGGDVGGSGSVAGTLDGRSFDSVAAAYLIGSPDDPKRTSVVYVFDAPIACSELSSPGWDESVANATQSLEMKLIGKSPATYPIPADGTPATGESDVNYTVTSTSGTPSEVSALSGSVTLDGVEDGTSASGSFALTFPGGDVSGSFDAVWCADGHEP